MPHKTVESFRQPEPLEANAIADSLTPVRSTRAGFSALRIFMACGIVLLAGVLPACQTTTHKEAKIQAEQRWNQVRGRVKMQLAERQYQAGRFDKAKRLVFEAIALNPSEADGYVLLARTNLELGKLASARGALETAKARGLESADLHYMRGVILEQRNKVDEAIDEYLSARRLDPNHIDALVAQVECLVAQQHPVEALRLIEENIDRLDDAATVTALAAHVASLVGDIVGASERYGQALETGAKSRVVAEELGRLLVGAGRYEEALLVLKPLLNHGLDPEAGGAVRRGLAICYLALNDPVSAKAVLVRFANSHADDTVAQLLLAKSAIASGDSVTALRALDRAEQYAPDRPEVWLVRATVRWERGDTSGAAADLYDVLEDNPEDVEAHCLLAEVLRAEQHFDAAREHFERAIEIDPGCSWAAAGLKSLRTGRDRTSAGPATSFASPGRSNVRKP